jgi:hypothetical protein
MYPARRAATTYDTAEDMPQLAADGIKSLKADEVTYLRFKERSK